MENLFVTCPETILPNGLVVPSFRVGQYACSRGEEGKAAVTAEDKPWVNINFRDAQVACERSGYQMITETQWLALAWNASQQDANWTGGKVGKGDLFQGLRNGHVYEAQPGTYESKDPEERRWLMLSNGERICDLNGNVGQWVFDDVQGDEQGLIIKALADDSPSIATAPYPCMEKGMGLWSKEGRSWSGYALNRGGCWCSGSGAGAFNLSDGWPGDAGGGVGFRCTQP